MQQHVPRTLSYLDDAGRQCSLAQDDIVNLPQPLIILGEPGSGKTALLEWLGEDPRFKFIPAAKLVHRPASSLAVPDGGALLIDGLDELAAVRDSDPVCRVLGKLEEAGRPPFILSCRSLEWSGAIARRDIADDYGAVPRQLWLDPFSRADAVAFLARSLSPDAAEAAITHLDDKGIPDIYGNPLTLQLLARVLEAPRSLPDSRAELLDTATQILWRERPDRRVVSDLARLDADTALSAAGLIGATYVLTGAGAISPTPSGPVSDEVVHLPDLASLPGADHASIILGSRLFPPITRNDGNFRPIHRSVAEFLGADWLARSARDDLARDRIMAMLTSADGVPASLRGLHAWIARDVRFTEQVIRTDPFGLLLYGDADNLELDHARLLLRELSRLHTANPLFRSEDWHSRRVKSLGRPELIDDVRGLLFAKSDNSQLKTLVLTAIAGSPLAALLTDDLQAIVLDKLEHKSTYAERHDAALALLRLDTSAIDWAAVVRTLVEQRGEDSTRLAIDIMTARDFAGFTAEHVIQAVLTHYDLDREKESPNGGSAVVGTLFYVGRKLPEPLIAPVLDGLAARLPKRDPDLDPPPPFELSGLITRLIGRTLEQAPPPPDTLLRWLQIIADRHAAFASDADQQRLQRYLLDNDAVRRAIQHSILLALPDPRWPHHALWRTRKISPALALSPGDIAAALEALARLELRDAHHVTTWQQLINVSGIPPEHAPAIMAAATAFIARSPEQQEFLDHLQRPREPEPWEIEEAQRRRDFDDKRAREWAGHRAHFTKYEVELRAGDVRYTYPIAQAYVGLFSDFDRDAPPLDRLRTWLGEPLLDPALAGLSATLARPDLPTPEVVTQSYAEQRRWHFILPMIAAVAERCRRGESIDPLPLDIRTTVLIGLHNEHIGDRIRPTDLAERLTASIRVSGGFERYITLLLEPSLKAGRDHIPGLYAFVRSDVDRPLARRLCLHWLEQFASLPGQVEDELIDGAEGGAAAGTLSRLARSRLASIPPTSERAHAWLAVEFCYDFETFASSHPNVAAADASLIWALRHRLGDERHASHHTVPILSHQLKWTISALRGHWPHTAHPSGAWNGSQNEWDASDFLMSCINRLAADSSDAAGEALSALIRGCEDTYTPYLKNAFAHHRRLRRDRLFTGPTIPDIRSIVTSRPPSTTADLSAIVLHALSRLQQKLHGSDLDRARKYRPADVPVTEDACTDLLIQDLEHLLLPFGINMIPQKDMPADKRADIVFQHGSLELPAECKGQWHRDLWSAAISQLDRQYVRDWHAQDRGLYIVYWFGSPAPAGKKLQPPPAGTAVPETPQQLRDALQSSIPPDRLPSISVAVVDLS